MRWEKIVCLSQGSLGRLVTTGVEFPSSRVAHHAWTRQTPKRRRYPRSHTCTLPYPEQTVVLALHPLGRRRKVKPGHQGWHPDKPIQLTRRLKDLVGCTVLSGRTRDDVRSLGVSLVVETGDPTPVLYCTTAGHNGHLPGMPTLCLVGVELATAVASRRGLDTSKIIQASLEDLYAETISQ